jgi:hypothetical protein
LVVSAICCNDSRSTGTRCNCPLMSTTPVSVPNAIVDTGTLAAIAAADASSTDRPEVR